MTQFPKLLSTTFFAAVFLLTAASAYADRTLYVVESGDMLGSLARRFDCTVNQIREWNELEGDFIRVGQELVVFPGSAPSVASSGGWANHVVSSGDTLGAIASRYDVTVDEIVSWNDGLNPDRIRVGQEIAIRGTGRSTREITYEVAPGDFVSGIARRFDVTIAEIVSWNSGLDPDMIRIGQELTIVVEGPERRSESVGRANRGSLENPEQLPPHRGYVIRDDDLAWGTNETITAILDGFDAVRSTHSRAARVEMHDLSDDDGGRLSGHRSHQSGRDADIGLYRNDCGDVCRYGDIEPDEFDVATQWTLIRHWINHDQMQYIFLAYDLQEPLYEYVRDVRGATESQLDDWFQYPHGRRTARGLIRHEPNHADHIHVRFGCPGDDDDCR